MLSARGLTKSFGDFTAVDGIDFEVRKGESFGFLGPNGAGKSSTMRMVAAVSPVTSGELRIFGLDPAVDGTAIKARLGNCPQQDRLDEELSVEENLWVYGRFFGLTKAEVRARADELLDFAQLTERRKDKVEPLSGGMKRRLVIARSLINNPELLLLDEPTTGLDPQARHNVWQKMRLLKSRGVTMVLTTHYMDEAAHLCDRLVIMHRGTILTEGNPHALIARHAGTEVLELRMEPDERAPLLSELGGIAGVTVEEVEDLVYVYGAGPRAREMALHVGDPGRAFLRPGNLEDVFLRLTGRGLMD